YAPARYPLSLRDALPIFGDRGKVVSDVDHHRVVGHPAPLATVGVSLVVLSLEKALVIDAADRQLSRTADIAGDNAHADEVGDVHDHQRIQRLANPGVEERRQLLVETDQGLGTGSRPS